MEQRIKLPRSNSSRRPIKSQHELFCINSFIQWHAHTFRSQYRLIDRPDPPDGIIRTGRSTCWIEVADAPWCSDWARDVYSCATPEERYRPMASPISSGAHSSPDSTFSKSFVGILKEKLEKKTYEPVFKKFGTGYLILCILYPLFSDSTIKVMRSEWKKSICDNQGYFRSVFFTFPHLTKPHFWRWSL